MKILYITDLTSVPCEIAIDHDLTIVYGEGYHEFDAHGVLIKDDRSISLIRAKFTRQHIEPPEIIRVESLKQIAVDVVLKDLTNDSTLWKYGDFSKVTSKYGVFRILHDEYTKGSLLKVFGEQYVKNLVMIDGVMNFLDKLPQSAGG